MSSVERADLPPFARRHIGPGPDDVERMLATVGAPTVEALVAQAVPESIRSPRGLDIPEALDEHGAMEALRERADANQIWRSYLGMGYHGCLTPPVIQRNILENPGWYTAYTPYQAEISQGRLEALLNYQTMVQELCGLDIANASMLDEATAAAEAMTLCHRSAKGQRDRFVVSSDCHPQNIAVVVTRALPLGIRVDVVDPASVGDIDETVCGVLVQYPATDGRVSDLSALCERVHRVGAHVVVATDLLALCLLRSPGELGADVAVGNSQRFGVPLGYGGPHAGFMATRDAMKRQLPGRVIGISHDAQELPALRMALQTREQHIRRERATSNICTAQVLLAVMASMYAVWHGPRGLQAIAERVHGRASALAAALRAGGYHVVHGSFFDTVRVVVGPKLGDIQGRARERRINLRELDGDLVIALDETVSAGDLADLCAVFGVSPVDDPGLPHPLRRTSAYLQEEVFSAFHGESEMMRYLHRLASRDLALNTSMIPLGSCTMKLNAAAEMIPITLPGFSRIHPFAPRDQTRGYARLFGELERWLAEITGFHAVSLQPNAGSQGEYAGLLTIRAYHHARGGAHRDVCLIPTSAHGTNPASAVMAGLTVVPVACDDRGNIDVADLRAKAAENADRLSALMVTYPSTHGVFEEAIGEICRIVHAHGGQVYLDGANMNAMVGLCRPGDIGADVCHLNLHKTFAIPHGGGGPGMGPIAVAAHLAPYLPGHPVVPLEGVAGPLGEGPVSAGPWGSPSILPITWAYIRMLGPWGLKRSSEIAILNANYVASRLDGAFPVLYRGTGGRVAHECILDLRPFKAAGVLVDDVAKRLMDFGFHSPTMSFPVAGTLMVEPTESESKAELDRFVDAMLAIREEIRDVEAGRISIDDSPLRHAPHTARVVTADEWTRAYSRTQAAWPAPWLRSHKYWPPVSRIDNAYGDRNLICTCDAWPLSGPGDAGR